MAVETTETVRVLQTYHRLMASMRDHLIRMTSNDTFNEINKYLNTIADYEAEMERYFREEAYGTVGSYRREDNSVVIETVPEGLSFDMIKEGVDIRGIPLWTIGYSGRKHPSSSHGGRPFVRTVPFWNYLIQQLKMSYLAGTPRGEILLHEYPPQDANVSAVFRAKYWNIRDLDHYDLGPLINACVGNGLLWSDHPSSLTLTLKWVEDDSNSMDFCIRYKSSR